MNKTLKLLLEKAEELGWHFIKSDGDIYEFEKFSPYGQDFIMYIDTENDPALFLDNLFEYYTNYDVSEEAYYWLDDTGHGKNGAPYEMIDVYKDFENCEQMILDLYRDLNSYYKTLP